MDPKCKKCHKPISIGMLPSGWWGVHGLIAMALRHPRIPLRMKGLGKKVLMSIEDVLHEKGFLSVEDIAKIRRIQSKFEK